MMSVADGIDFVDVIAHGRLRQGCSIMMRRERSARGAPRCVGGHGASLRQWPAGARRAHFHAGAALDRLHHGGEILVRSVLVAGGLQELRDGFGNLHRHAERLALAETQLEVLRHQPHGETEIEGAGQHHAAELVLGRGVAAGARIDHVEHDAGIEPRLHAHDHRLRRGGHGGGGKEIVAELHGLPGARPLADSAGSIALTSARGPEAINASVPFAAPVTPPLTGQSICTMFLALSSSKMRLAMTAPVVDRSTKRRTRLPSITPPGPVATASTTSGVGRLTITVSTASAISRGEPAACAPSAVRRSTASRRVSNTTRAWPASTSRRAMWKPIWPSPMKPISIVVPPSMQRFGPLAI